MGDLWKSWNEVKKICKDKTVVFWGRSEDWIPKTVKKIENCVDKIIIDRNPTYEGSSFRGLPIYLPSKIDSLNVDNIYIIITGGVYESIAEDLIDMGFTPGKNFCCTPEIKDWGLLQEIREYDKNIIVSCSDYSEKGGKRYSKLGGGIYICNTRNNSLEKKIGGHFREIIKVEDQYYVTEFVEKKIYVLSKDFQKINEYNVDQTPDNSEKPNGCGIAYHSDKQLFFVANAASDTINIYHRDSFKYLDTIHMSDRFRKTGDGQHHINDICIADNFLLVSCFSVSGNWKRGIMDGGVVQFDLDDLTKPAVTLFTDLWMPHSVQYIDGTVCVLDSMRGDFYVGNQKIEGNFPGFTRGLAYDNRFYYIGQSEDMYMSRLFGVKQNIMCNAGVYLFDINNKVSRFYSFPYLMNVHDILIEEN